MKLARLLFLLAVLGSYFFWQQNTPEPLTTNTESNQDSTGLEVETSTTTVTSVTDGDTFTIENDTVIRVIGIDTPETQYAPDGAECYGEVASNRAKELLMGTTVALTTDDTQAMYDDYGRLLAYVTLPDGQDYGEQMIREGFAYEYTFIKPYQKQSLYRTAETTAKENKVGLWETCR